MTRQILIDSIVRQTTILIAQLATSGGVRSPLSQVADRVFLDLARELDSQGISRKVSADMFGMALRSYRRRLRQLGESSTERGRSLWEAVLAFLSKGNLVTRDEVLRRFNRDDEASVKGVLNDLCESGLVFKLGAGRNAAYRGASADELNALRDRNDGLSELICVIVYREGPISIEDLAARISAKSEVLEACLSALVADGRLSRDVTGRYTGSTLIIPVGASAGWEAAFFDHFQAVVRTMCARLVRPADAPADTETGGSTYTFSVWAGHPFEDEARGLLREFRERHSALRERIAEYNADHPVPESFDRITVYGGLSLIHEEGGAEGT